MRLNGWQRLGGVFSIILAVGAAGYGRKRGMEGRKNDLSTSYANCLENEYPNLLFPTLQDCFADRNKAHKNIIQPLWGDIAFYSLAPILAGWIVVYLAIRIFRWVRAGFMPERVD